eukprot:TRINITY_DN9256_c0_g1_i1.p1 TRINITY_DN9256_c0_g1~~TRINITY_DN9256_c0_g1_i1.p1  ORF type:complete len:229 (-),score=49.45 TRINITY_DN9256_c0_g1_i1:170-856(-)
MNSVAAVPNICHLSRQDFIHIYEPADDTYLFLDALLADREFLNGLRPKICIEIGTGSGVLITHLASLVGPQSTYFATDVNPKAALAALATARNNKASVDVVLTDLVGCLQARLKGRVDVLLFNPPYVPSTDDEYRASLPAGGAGAGIDAAWAGGQDGRMVLDRLLPMINELLSPGGCFYLLAIDENKPDEIVEILRQHSLSAKLVLQRKAMNEMQCILRFQKPVAKAD